jgi:hypothetical protein
MSKVTTLIAANGHVTHRKTIDLDMSALSRQTTWNAGPSPCSVAAKEDHRDFLTLK